MTTTLRVRALLVAALALAGGCQSPGFAAAPRPSPPPAPPPVRAFATCFTPAPAAWAGTQRASLPTTQFDPQAVTPGGDRVFGSYRTTSGESGIGAIDLASGALTRVVRGSGGASLALDPPWLAWVDVASATNPGAWTLEARNLDTGQQFTVATPGPAGLGQPAVVAVGGGRVALAEPTTRDPQTPTAEVRVYDLAARRQTVLDSGGVGPPVLAGRDLVWARAGAGLQAVDAATLQPAALPERVRGLTPGDLAGSPNFLVWSTDAQHAAAWRIDRDRLATYAIGDSRHRLQFLTVAGHFLIWFTSTQYAVLDLDTGGGYDVPLPNAVFGSEPAIVRTTSLGGTPKGAGPGTVVSVLATATAPAIPGCGGR